MIIILAITGASGVVYGTTLLRTLHEHKGVHEIHLVISENARRLIEIETTLEFSEILKLATHYYENHDLGARIGSGSFKFDAMVIIPCSMNTAAKLAHGISDNLITRAGAISLKEHRKLIIVPRETPVSTVHLQNMIALSRNGAVVLPAMPAFYHKPEDIDDLVKFIVARVLDILGIGHELHSPWEGTQGRMDTA